MNIRSLLPAMVAGCLQVPGFVAAAEPAAVTLSDLIQTYDGGAKLPTVVTEPAGLAYEWHFTPTGAPPPGPVDSTVYSNMPAALELSYQSVSFSAQRTWAVGDLVNLAGTARDLVSVDTVLVTWARASNYPLLAAENPEGWEHPVTATIYSMNDAGILTFVGERTRNVFVPWRPLTLPNGSPYPHNGIAFRVSVDFPAGVTLPERPMVMFSFNTQSTGFSPIGSAGPYNELNLAVVGAPATTGSNVHPFTVLWVRENSWAYPTTLTPDPLFEVVASELVDPGSAEPPVHAGSYQATATLAGPDFAGEATATFVIEPAAATIEWENLTQVGDGLPKPVTVTTDPPGLPVEILYDGSATAPAGLGSYPVTAAVTDPNYVGNASATLRIGHDLDSWLLPWITDLSLPPLLAGEDDDAEMDGIVNLLEYAFGLNPVSADHGDSGRGLPVAEWTGDGLALVYRKNLLATDLTFEVQVAGHLDDPDAWTPVVTADSVVSEADGVQVIRALIPAPEGNVTTRFARLSVTRVP